MKDVETLHVPVYVEYQVKDGVHVVSKEEYADVPVSVFVDMFVRTYGHPSTWEYPET